ncbi:MAG: hypothetical protein HY978_02620 [Candidatus Liptonbacteria bacterium]|nr:hypothetical protein [Candidatus Liptonbacteria bacterium]
MATVIVKEQISREELKRLTSADFGNLVKAVVDTAQEIAAIGGEMHADMEVMLTEQEHSRRENTWGVNLYLDLAGDDFLEFDSMINLKPAYGNRSRGVENPEVREKIRAVVNKLLK